MNPAALLSLLTLGVTILHYRHHSHEPIISDKDLHTTFLPTTTCCLCHKPLWDNGLSVFVNAQAHNSCWIDDQFMQERNLDRLTRKNREKELV